MIRPYRPGDDVRHIDWNVTARMREPHVRVHVGERAMTAWLLLDVSASMTFGTADRRKADVAEGVALAIGHVATRRGNRLGVVAIGGGEPRIMRPRQGRLGLLALLAELRTEPEADGSGATALGDAARRTAALARNRGLVVVVSDFRGDARLGGAAARAARPPRRARRRDPRPARARAAAGRRPLGHRSRDRPPAERQHQPPRRAQALRQGGRRRARGGRRGAAARRRRAPRAVHRGRLAARARRAPAALGDADARGGEGARHDLPRARRPASASRCCRSRPPPTRSCSAAAARDAARFGNPALLPEPRHRAPGLAPAPAAVAAAARARRADRRARAAAAHRRGAAAPGDGDDGHRRLGLDAGHRRRARPPVGRRRGRPRARRQAARQAAPRARLVLRLRRADRPAHHRARSRSRTRSTGWWPTAAPRWATRCARGIESARTPVPNEDGSGSRRLPAVIVLLSDGKNTSGNRRRSTSRARRRRCTSRSTRSRSAPRAARSS